MLQIHIKTVLPLSGLIVCISLLGCSSMRTRIRLQHVGVPGYDREAYEELLLSENEEVKCNAICNLIPEAQVYAHALRAHTKDPAETDSVSHRKATRILDLICAGMYSKNEDIQAASLMFVAEYAGSCSDTSKLYGMVCGLETSSRRIQYEQIRAMGALVHEGTALDGKQIEGFLGSRSWLVRSATYEFLGRVPCEEFHEGLIDKYAEATEEHDKLLILQAFAQQYGPTVFEFLVSELAAPRSTRIHGEIADILPKYRDASAVGRWIAKEHSSLKTSILKRIINQYASPSCSQNIAFFEALLSTNESRLDKAIAESSLFPVIYNTTEDDTATKEAKSRARNLLELFRKNESVGRLWDAYKERRDKDELPVSKPNDGWLLITTGEIKGTRPAQNWTIRKRSRLRSGKHIYIIFKGTDKGIGFMRLPNEKREILVHSPRYQKGLLHVDYVDIDGDGDRDLVLSGIEEQPESANERVLGIFIYEQDQGVFRKSYATKNIMIRPIAP